MKYLSTEAFERLERVKRESFLTECTQKLQQLQIKGAFPSDQKEYYAFAKHIFDVAQMYDIKDKEAIFALMMAWHIKGDGIVRDQKFLSILKDRSLKSGQKIRLFHKYIKEALKQGEKDEG